jgi:hypothetical protein
MIPLNQHVWDGQGFKDPCLSVLNQHVWDGQGLRETCFFGTFSGKTKSYRKAYFMREKLDSLKR